MTDSSPAPQVSAVRATGFGLRAVWGSRGPTLALIAAFAAEGLVDVGVGFAVFALFVRGGTVGGAALGGLFVLWVLARTLRFLAAGGLLSRLQSPPVGFLAVASRALIALGGTLLVDAFVTAWKWAALTATGWAFLAALAAQEGGGRAAFALALCLVLLLWLALFVRMWVEAALVASVMRDEPFATSLARAALALAQRPAPYLGILLLTGIVGGVGEVALAGILQLFTAGDLPPDALLPWVFASRAAAAILVAWPLAFAWGTRVAAFAALDLDSRGQLPAPPPPKAAPVPKAIPVAELLPPDPV